LTPAARRGKRPTQEIWDYVTDAPTGILTTLGDGVPIAMPIWFACVDRTIYIRHAGKKLQRIAR
jgi:hypothetical protein